MAHPLPLPWGRHYPPYQIAALVRLLRGKGLPADGVFASAGLDAAALDDVACRTSVLQHLAAWRHALELGAGSGLAFQLGRALHLPDHGTCGLMLLSCDSVADYFRLAQALVYGLGGIVVPFLGIKAIDLLVTLLPGL